ncbi:MAG: radical SAM protein [Candidatus Nitrospinota bacterium M3_3B_026]
MSFIPYAVSWNLTSRCNLSCRHCYIDANGRVDGGADELSPEKALDVVSQVAALNPGAVLILTGGEPLAREDIYDVIEKASGLGLMAVLGTNGTLLTPETVRRLKDAGAAGVGVSIDSLNAERHDSFRGKPGALSKAMAGLAAAKEAGLGIQVQTTPTRDNIDELPLIAEWASRFGARVFNIFFLVCTGRGEKMTDITPDEYEKVLKWAAAERDSYPGMMIRPKCAPHFKRILYQENPENSLLKTYIAACRAGTHYMRITPSGKVTPCPYMETEAGDLSAQDLASIWEGSEVLGRYRSPEYGGKCGACRYRLLCGGCRARALADTGDDMGEDQWCVYEPVGQEEAIENIDTMSKFGGAPEGGGEWSKEAEDILLKIPVFARPIVKLGVEKYAAENGIDKITVEVMRKAAPSPKMFDGAGAAPSSAAKEDDAGEMPWDADALERVENAPDFVRPGIYKLMRKRAKERGQERITSKFLTEIRDESMMLVTRRMKKMGFESLDMGALAKAKEKLPENDRKREVIERITDHLASRPEKNEAIMKKFGAFFADDVGEKMGWTEGARKRLEKAPPFAREMAKKFVEKHARKNGFKYVTEEALEAAMADSPMSRFTGKAL